MKKYLLILCSISILMMGFFILDTWKTVSESPMITHGSIILTDRTGRTLTHRSRRDGYSTPYTGSLDTDLVRAIITIEDHRYREHSGVDLRGKLASIYQNLQAGAVVRGGSTLTEQYIKNTYYPNAPRTIIQKLRESIGALILEQRMSKDEILRSYLDHVYMGNGLYGIQSALDGYSHQPTAHVGMINQLEISQKQEVQGRKIFSKGVYGSVNDGENNFSDEEIRSFSEISIVDIVTRIKWPNITEKNRSIIYSYRESISRRLGIELPAGDMSNAIHLEKIDLYPLMTTAVLSEIDSYCRSSPNHLDHWTLQIPGDLCTNPHLYLQLSIDQDLMSTSLSIARGVLDTLRDKRVGNASVYIIHPGDHQILAYIANTAESSQIDMIQRCRSVGSILKPLIYLLALREGADAEDYLLDDQVSYRTTDPDQAYTPENYITQSYGPIRLREALGNSLNTATVRLTDTLGIMRVYDALRISGIELEHDAGYYGYGLSIGTIETTLEDIVESYETLVYTPNRGGVSGKQEIDPDRWQIAHILSDPRNRARTFGYASILNSSLSLPVKTGTSTDFRDNWAVSYHTDAIIGVWVGNTDNSPMGDVSGVTGAGPIWHHIAEYMISRGMIRRTDSPAPPPLRQISICLDLACTRTELSYSKKTRSPASRPLDRLYHMSDFFGAVSEEEREKWGVVR